VARLAKLAPLLLLTLACGRGGGTVIQETGSETLLNVARAWAAGYRHVDRSVTVTVSGGGSDAGIAAIVQGSVDVATATRAITSDELTRARSAGHIPIEHIVGYDELAVFLNRSNPLDSISIPQLAEIFGKDGTARSWSDLGVTVPGCDAGEIVPVGRQRGSGTYAYFESTLLGEGAYGTGVRAEGTTPELVQLVASTPCAIGYGSLTYATDGVKTPCVSTSSGSHCIAPSPVSAADGTYPIARPVFMYTSGLPQGAIAHYMTWIMSDEGQCILQDVGYAPARPVACS
jgi:phosphate transport system substrate-binding protein